MVMKHLEREIELLKRKALSLSSLVEESVYLAIRALLERDSKIAQQVLQADDRIDQIEVEVEEECLKVLALHQPVAIDLRVIVSILKINNDLERIGDLACGIAHRARAVSQFVIPVESRARMERMAEKVRWMLRSSLQAMVTLDTELARQVCGSDSEVDQMNKDTQLAVVEMVKSDPQNAQNIIYFLGSARNLERIADHSTNIAEDVIYLTEGEIVRHGRFWEEQG